MENWESLEVADRSDRPSESRISENWKVNVSEFNYGPVDFADADYILKGMSGILRSAVGRKAVVKAVENVDAQKASEAMTLATVGQMVLDGKLGKVAQKRAMAIVA